MRPTSAFAAPFGFVGWTISSPLAGQGGLPYSLYTFPGAIIQRKGLARDYPVSRVRLPRVWQVSPGDYSPGCPMQWTISRRGL